MNIYSDLINILPKNVRVSGVILTVLVAFAVFFEGLSISLLLPLFNVMLERNNLEQSSAHYIFELFGFSEEQLNLVNLLILICCVYLTKVSFISLVSLYQARFSATIQRLVSSSLFKGYLAQDWIFYSNRKTSELIRISTFDVYVLIYNFISPSIHLLSECAIIIGLGIILFLLEPVGFIMIAFILLIMGSLFFIITRDVSNKLGARHQVSNGERIETLQIAFRGFKTLRANNKLDYYVKTYDKHNKIWADTLGTQEFISTLPRHFFEVVAVISISVLAYSLYYFGNDFDTIIVTIGFFTAAAFRILPSVSRISYCLQNIQYAKPIIGTILNEFKSFEDREISRGDVAPLPYDDRISFKKVSFSYPGTHTKVFDNADLHIAKNDFVGIVGRTGAGKTTFVDLLLGFWKPNNGKILTDGIYDISTNDQAWRRLIGYVPQNNYIINGTIAENIALGCPKEEIDRDKVLQVASITELDEYLYKLNDGIDSLIDDNATKLSGGQAQRICIARALYREPEILILDESTSALYQTTEDKIIDSLLNLRGRLTVIMISHKQKPLEICDKIYDIANGKFNSVKP